MERKYEINQKLVKIYYLESGGVTLIQNGRKAQPITEGIHLYLNKPSQGRVLYQPNIPISYASVLLFEDYIHRTFFLSFGIRHHLPFEKSDPFGLTRILMIGLNNACFHNSTCDHSSIPITGTSSVRSLLFSSGSPAYCSSSGSSLRKPLPFLVPVILSVHLYL